MTLPLIKPVVAIALAVTVGAGCASSKPAKAPTPTPRPAPAAQAVATPLPRDVQVEAYVASMRADLSRGKVGIINDVMRLSNDEAKVFWPIYERYESELFDLGDERLDGIRRFAAAQRDGRLSDADAQQLATRYFDFERKRLDLLKSYHDEIAAALSPVRAAQFTQVEHRVGTLIDLLIAAGLPVIQPAAVASH